MEAKQDKAADSKNEVFKKQFPVLSRVMSRRTLYELVSRDLAPEEISSYAELLALLNSRSPLSKPEVARIRAQLSRISAVEERIEVIHYVDTSGFPKP